MKDYFETSFGDRIAVMPPVEEILYPHSNDEAYFRDSLENLYTSERFLQKNIVNPARITEIGSDLNTYTLVIDFLDELRLLSREYDRALDIAGAEGVHGALLRGHYARQVDVADVQDGTDPRLTRKLRAALWKYRFYKLEDRLFNGGSFRHRVPRVKNNKHLNLPSFKHYYDFRFKRKPMIDRFIIGDWRKTVTGPYDFIMNFMCFWLWDHRVAIPKIASLLAPGGIFVTLAPYAWAGRGQGDGGALMGGGFPYFEQRLTLEDTKKYYEEFKPNLAKYVVDACSCFDPSKPTIDDYTRCALASGLLVKGTKRIYNNDQKYALTYKEFFGDRVVVNPGSKTGIVADAGEILLNISRFRDDVTFEDLLTRAAIVVLEKPA